MKKKALYYKNPISNMYNYMCSYSIVMKADNNVFYSRTRKHFGMSRKCCVTSKNRPSTRNSLT